MNTKQLKDHVGQVITLKGWVANRRESKTVVFINLRDGQGICQCILGMEDLGDELFQTAKTLGQESSVSITGKVVEDTRQIGGFELHATDLKVYQNAKDYPISNKEHGIEFLIDHRHLWLRSRRQWAIMRIRNSITYAIHNFFQEQGFVQMDAPIFTGNAAEGTTDLFETDYYGKPAYLTQSGQLYGEAMALAMGKIYTFGPTFRAEKSKTRRHLSEFWMIEPEMAFCDIYENMDTIESFLRSVVQEVLEKCPEELEILNRDTSKLETVSKKFPRLSYDEAVEILKGNQDVDGQNTLLTIEQDIKNNATRIVEIKEDIAQREAAIAAGGMKKGAINFNQNKIDTLKQELKQVDEDQRNLPQWLESARNFEYGNDFGGSDETVLTRLFDCPIMVYDWPHEIKAFYMKRNPEDPRFARGVDVLAPEGYGEIVGGGERETSEEWLVEKINEHKLPMDVFQWYLDLRRYGSVPHSGFGLGLERLVAWICKLDHVRETIPFPRYYGRLEP
ncbi:MAG: asparagine--tRNA ligase [Bacteroidia bacterium]|nr:asparagine--tRNA ligase [Bacteroidia bacterium]MDG2042840.1 asparagine--tRNA ligase [Bacteroidia bacterium]|tara:strand:+ start:161 stop:1675 length:1515 start_codon:yes stop_codon:yes gene_type:complete